MEQLVELSKTLCTAIQQIQLQNQILKQQENLEKILLKQIERKEGSRIFPAESINSSLSEFRYMPEEAINKVRNNLFQKMSIIVGWRKNYVITPKVRSSKYKNFILPKKPEEIEILPKVFCQRDSLFHTRCKCFNIKQEDEDFISYAAMWITQN